MPRQVDSSFDVLKDQQEAWQYDQDHCGGGNQSRGNGATDALLIQENGAMPGEGPEEEAGHAMTHQELPGMASRD